MQLVGVEIKRAFNRSKNFDLQDWQAFAPRYGTITMIKQAAHSAYSLFQILLLVQPPMDPGRACQAYTHDFDDDPLRSRTTKCKRLDHQ